jgi:hypothetical protein
MMRVSGSTNARWNVELESHNECIGDQNDKGEVELAPAILRDLGFP